MNKRGQFYIVAAIIIVLILAGITSVRTYAIVRPEPRAIQDLGSELQEETSRIVDYGIYNSSEDLTALLNNFTDEKFAPYFLQKTTETAIVFVYGNKTDLFAVRYKEEVTGGVSATLGGSISSWTQVKEFAERVSVDTSTEPIKVIILDKTFEFDLQGNQMFYFVILKEKNGETYVERN